MFACCGVAVVGALLTFSHAHEHLLHVNNRHGRKFKPSIVFISVCYSRQACIVSLRCPEVTHVHCTLYMVGNDFLLPTETEQRAYPQT